MIDAPQILHTVAQTTAIVPMIIPRSEIRTMMGPAYRELMSTLAAQGITPAGRWFSHHHRMHPDTFDFEIGVPVHQPVAPAGRVTNGTLPAARVARTIYRGSYEGLGEGWGELKAWIAAQGLTTTPALWEVYLTDPSSTPDPADYQTELTWPLVD